MPLRLSNAPNIFMRLKKKVLRPYIVLFVEVFFNDIHMYSKIEQDHVQHLKQVFSTLREQKLYGKLEKGEFFILKAIFLGYVASYDGTQADETNVEAIRS